MHEIEFIEGDMVVRHHNWIQAGNNPPRYVRLGGYAGAPTAELVRLPCGWLAHSWLTGAARAAHLPLSMPLDWAVREVELAEADGSAAKLWLPLRAPRQQDEWDEAEDLGPIGYMTYGDENWAKQFDRGCVFVRQVTGRQGLAKFVAVAGGLRIPMHPAHPYRFQAAQRSEVMAPTVPISSRPPF